MKTQAALVNEVKANQTLLSKINAMRVWQTLSANGQTKLGFKVWYNVHVNKMVDSWIHS